MRFSKLGGMPCGQDAHVARGAKRPARRSLALFGPNSAVEAMEARLMPAVTISLDYSLDVNGFFSSPARRYLMQYAADAVSSALTDTLSAITPNVGAGNTWTADFPDPSSGATRSISNLTVPANTMIVYVGGSALAGLSEAGEGSTGGFSGSGDNAWLDTLSGRGKAGALATPATSFGPWGGSIRFDNSGNTNWYFGLSLAGLSSSQTDFLSVAEHEIGHVLGIGTADSWNTRVSNGVFTGPSAEAINGGQPVPVNATGDHWANSVRSNGGPALMDPVLTDGTRSLATSLDFAALRDIGWQVNAIPAPAAEFSAATYSVNETGGSLLVTVYRSGTPDAMSVNYSTSNNTARAGTDYQATSGTLSFAYGEIVKTFTIPILNDNAADGNESFNITLSSPTNGGAIGSPATALVTIIDAGTTVHAKAPNDFDGDGRSDMTLFHQSTASWLIQRSTAGLLTPSPSFGAIGYYDIPIMGDFDGVGHAEIGVFRPSTAQWFVLGPTGSRLMGTFGATNLFDIPVPGDYDGTGRTELAVFRPSTAQWFVLGPTGSRMMGSFGATNLFDIPVPGDYDGTGHTEMAVFRPSTTQWFVLGPSGSRMMGTFGAPNLFDVPAPGDYDGSGHTEMAIYRPSTGQWIALGPHGGYSPGTFGQTGFVDVPVETSVGSLVRLGVARRTAAIKVNGGPSSAMITEPIVYLAPLSTPTTSKQRSRDAVSAAWFTALEQLAAGS